MVKHNDCEEIIPKPEEQLGEGLHISIFTAGSLVEKQRDAGHQGKISAPHTRLSVFRSAESEVIISLAIGM